MKTNVATLTGMMFFLMVGSVMAEKPLSDYSFIRGACYPGGWRNSQAIIERDLGYAKKLNLNSTRGWLNYTVYEKNTSEILESIPNYIRTSHLLAISYLHTFSH